VNKVHGPVCEDGHWARCRDVVIVGEARFVYTTQHHNTSCICPC